ncbi:MAG: hypothetical protein HY858_11800 [Candidatus Solibacter usitatus]|nr:hypothetical protein [Candidatus Solibacter usitatus]
MILFWSHFANVRADWVQPVNGGSAIAEALKARGAGLFAVLYRVPSRGALELEAIRLQGLGVQVLEQGSIEFDDNYKVPYVYFDTGGAGGLALGLYYDPEPEPEAVRARLEVAQVVVPVPDPAATAAYWRRVGFAAGAPWAVISFQPASTVAALVFEAPDLEQAASQWTEWGFPQIASGSLGQAATPGYERYSSHGNTASPAHARLRWRWQAPAVLAASMPLQFTFPAGQAEPEFRVPVAKLGWPADWRAWRAMRFEFNASSLEPFSVGFSDGTEVKSLIVEPLPGLKIGAVIPFEAFHQTRAMTPLTPLGYKAWPQRLFTFEKVEELVFRMKRPAEASTLSITNLALTAEAGKDEVLERKPIIDRFGQWMSGDWPGKARSMEELRGLWNADKPQPAAFPFCPLGGDERSRAKASGYFRTELVAGRWRLVDPHGHLFYSTGMNVVNPRQASFSTRVTGREFLFEKLPEAGAAWLAPGEVVSYYLANIAERHGAGWELGWGSSIVTRLRSWGFNTIANWADEKLAASSGLAYTLPLAGWTTRKTFPFPWDFPDVYSAEFESNADEAARRQVAGRKDDANLIGWFIGNEPNWARGFPSLKPFAEMVLDDPQDSGTKRELRLLLAAYPDRAEEIKRNWMFTCGRRYFEVVVNAIRRYDGNHLVLGTRFAGEPREEWVRMSSLFDVLSINVYSEDYAPDHAQMDRYTRLSGRPVLIGEFTACAPGRGLQGLFYWGHKVKDQAERAKAYRYFVEKAASHPAVVGTHWFQLVDNLPTGRPQDGERLNYGFLNVLDLPYPELVRAAQETHKRIYEVKSGRTDPYLGKPAP